MEVRAVGKKIRVQPRKVRLVADEIRGKHAVLALAQLRYHPSKSARMLHKVLHSAVSNAIENDGLGAENLVVAGIKVDEGPSFKRMRPRAMGRGNVIIKRSSHITVTLREGAPFELPKSNAKPKPRPKFDAPKTKKEPAKAKPATAEAAPSEETKDVIEADTEVTTSAEPAGESAEPQEEAKGDES